MSHLLRLRVRPTEIARYNIHRHDPLAFLEIINSVPGSSWVFELRMVESMTPELRVMFPHSLPVDVALDGTFASVFDGSILTIEQTGQTESLSIQDLAAEQSVEFEEISSLALHDFFSDTFPSAWLDSQTIDRWLRRRTWLGSGFFEGSLGRVKLNVVGTTSVYSPNVSAESDKKLTASLDCHGKRIRIQVLPSSKRFDFRHAVLGQIQDAEELEPIARALKGMGLVGGRFEFGPEWSFVPGPLGTQQCFEDLTAVRTSLIDLVGGSSTLAQIASDLHSEKHRLDTQKLNNRIFQAERASSVVFEHKVLGKVPTSEAGAVALLHKLEVLGGIPLARFETVAWAAAEGIDAIAHFQIDDNHPVRTYAAVEYEFALDNFHRHQHPHEHVAMIVCWEARDRGIEMDSDFIGRIHGPDGEIPVLVISKFPGLSIVKEL